VRGIRRAGSSLLFLDIQEDGYLVQGHCDFKPLEAFGAVSKQEFKSFSRTVREGDILCE
jgi:hypothetical protein